MAGSEPVIPPRTHVGTVKDRLRNLLADGEYHSRDSLKEQSGCKNSNFLWVVIAGLRKELPADQDIICELIHRTVGYRKVKLFCTRSTRKNAKA